MSSDFLHDKDIYLAALEQDHNVIEYFDNNLKKSSLVIKKYLEKGPAGGLSEIPYQYASFELIRAALASNLRMVSDPTIPFESFLFKETI